MNHVILLLLAASSTLSCDLHDVQDLRVVVVKSYQITLGWSFPSTADLQCVQGYQFCSVGESHPMNCTAIQNANLSEYTFTGLGSCLLYNFSVAAIGENGTISESVFLSASTAPAPQTRLKVAQKDNQTITVSWWTIFSSRNMCVERFLLSLCDALGSNCSDTTVRMLGSEYKVDLPKPPSCRSYVVDLVLLDNRNHTSDVLRHVVDPVVINSPANLTVTSVTSRSFSAAWGIPDSQVGCEYFIHVYTECGGKGARLFRRNRSFDPGRTSHVETRGVAPCVQCKLAVHFPAQDIFKPDEERIGPSITMYTLPEGHAIFDNATVLEATSHSVMVGWKATLPVGGQCVAAYSVCWVQEGGTSNSGCRNTTTNQNNLQITGLAANTTYQLSLAALLHSGVRFGEMVLEVTTNSGAAGFFRNTLVGISTITLCLLALYS